MGAGKTFIMPHVSAIHNVKKQFIAFLQNNKNHDFKNTQIVYKKNKTFYINIRKYKLKIFDIINSLYMTNNISFTKQETQNFT